MKYVILFAIQSILSSAAVIKYFNSGIEVPLSFAEHYGIKNISEIEFSSSVIPFLEHFVSDGYIVVDALAGYGVSYVPLAKFVGHNGSIVAIERETTSFVCLEKNAINKPTWERTLLVHSDPTDSDGEDEDKSVSSIISAIGLPCPQFVHFNDHAELRDNDTYNTLLGSSSMLMRCLPLMLIDCRVSDVVTVSSTVEFLQQITKGLSYQLYWYSGDDILRRGGNIISQRKKLRVVAVPPHYRFMHGEATTKAHLRLIYIETPTSDPAAAADGGSTNSVWEQTVEYLMQLSPASQSHPSGTERMPGRSDSAMNGGLPRPFRISTFVTIWLADIAQWNSTFAFTFKTHFADVSAKGLHTHRISLVFSSQLQQMDRSQLIARSHCRAWTHQLFSHMATHHLFSPGEAPAAAAEERRGFRRACVAFAAGRIDTLQRLYSSRSDAAEDVVHADVSVGNEEAYTVAAQQSAAHQYYNLTAAAGVVDSGALMSQWFHRPPFGFKEDEAACGEPIWCSHALEIQRRIRAWQFPEERPGCIAGSSDRETKGKTKEKEDWSRMSSSTCASSKFLVYEPPSDKHGIGSLLELIAVTFRYAICLDRILVLRPYTEELTLQKWVHPGCGGNFLECYFHPVSGCQLSAEEIAAAPVSKDGFQFDRYPLRDERVLVLKGLPLEGECTLCYSEWKADSRFFDGLFTGAASFNGSNMHHLQHSAAFRSHVKLTWASHFLRYMLKPRPWFAEALSQIIPAAMQSPAAVSTVAADEGGDGVAAAGVHRHFQQEQLPLSAFPTRFISLHVRFGMKVAETALQPLTRYMDFIGRKLPYLTDIFVSTETEEVISTLISEYPEYRFHYLRYPRKEYLDLGLQLAHVPYHRGTDFVQEFVYSMANLHVAVEGSGFVGTLSSNWCIMIMHLERTRGDGGYEYFSMDTGSAFTSCF